MSEVSASTYSSINWGSVNYSQFNSASYRQTDWSSVQYSEFSSSSMSSVNWARVNFSELGRTDLTNLTGSLAGTYGSASSGIATQHISSSSYSYSASSYREIITSAANLGTVNITGSVGRIGDIYGINTGTNLNISNFDVGRDFMNLGTLNASLLAVATSGSNTIVNYNGAAVATLVGVTGITSVDSLFGAA